MRSTVGISLLPAQAVAEGQGGGGCQAELYAGMQQQALQRIAVRDADDWPVLACAMTLGCPVWTEDADFFGTGVATWTSDRIALYLA